MSPSRSASPVTGTPAVVVAAAMLLLAACRTPTPATVPLPAPAPGPGPRPAPAAGLPAPDRDAASRPRAREAGVVIGELPTGGRNAITDVPGVRVGHRSLRDAATGACTGVTVVLPHAGNLFREKVPAAVVVGNGYGKLAGSTQIEELGELETPIALTNTLAVGTVLDALVAHVLAQPGNAAVRSVNAVVGETNDGWLNDIRGRHLTAAQVEVALHQALVGSEDLFAPVAEGAVGAGTGTVCFGYKGGIGTASRRVEGFTVGVLVQTNFGGRLTIAGVPVYKKLRADARRDAPDAPDARDARDAPDNEDGSCMIIVATDAPLDARNLRRLARRALVGMARTGAAFADGSGDYVIAFSTAEELRIRPDADRHGGATLPNGRTTLLFLAVAEATEEAIVNSLFRAITVESRGRTVPALPLDRVLPLLR